MGPAALEPQWPYVGQVGTAFVRTRHSIRALPMLPTKRSLPGAPFYCPNNACLCSSPATFSALSASPSSSLSSSLPPPYHMPTSESWARGEPLLLCDSTLPHQLPLTRETLQKMQLPPLSLAERLSLLIRHDVSSRNTGAGSMRAAPSLGFDAAKTTDATEDDMSLQENSGLAAAAKAQFFIFSAQAPVVICEQRTHRVPDSNGCDLTYLLLRLRGRARTLPRDARLHISFAQPRPEATLLVSLAQVRLKGGRLVYGRRSRYIKLQKTPGLASYGGTLPATAVRPRLWAKVSMHNHPCMFVAFVAAEPCCSLPIFVELTAGNARSARARDPVVGLPRSVLAALLHPQTWWSAQQQYRQQQPGELSSSQRREFEHDTRALDRLTRLSSC